MKALLSCSGITKRFGGVAALSGVGLELYPGEIHALIGENGAGKSTLIKILSGIYTKDAGQLIYEGTPVEIDGVEAAKKMRIAVIHQELSVVTALTVVENVFLGKELIRKGPVKTLDTAEMKRQAKVIFDSLHVSMPLDVPAEQLSVAQRQLIEIAKALRENARVLILDEPTTALTNEEADSLFRVLDTIKAQGTAILYVSHRLEEIYRISDKITVFRDGKLVGCELTADLPQEKLISMMVGRELLNMYPKKQIKLGEVVLEVRQLSRRDVVQDISLQIRTGEILGIGGLVGAGRTELVRILAGVDKADSGEIVLGGRQLRLRDVSDAIKNGIVLVPEDRKRSGLLTELSITHNTTLPTVQKLQRFFRIQSKKEQAEVEGVVKKLSIKISSVKSKVSSLSGGNQQKVAIGKWLLINDIKVLILDEPTRGVDVGAKTEIYKIMESMLEQGTAILMVSSDLPELLAMSDRIMVMREGKMMGQLEKSQATEESVMSLATGRTHNNG